MYVGKTPTQDKMKLFFKNRIKCLKYLQNRLAGSVDDGFKKKKETKR